LIFKRPSTADRCWLAATLMRTYDLSPLFRSTIGFDRLFDLVETAQRAGEDHYPPYNIERLSDDRYQITLAVAGSLPTRSRSPPNRTSSPLKATRPKRPSGNSA
jgi:molecular chaperone IbpA